MARTDRPSLRDLERNRVKTFGPHSLIPGWKEDAAAWGIRFVMTKVFHGIRHPSGYKMGPSVKGFAGQPAESINGLTYTLDRGTIWLSAEMKSWEGIVNAAAHETAHTFDVDHGIEHYHDHELPTLVGKLAAAHWAGNREVYVKWGRLPDNWLPEGESEVPANAVVLHFEDGDHCTLVNVGQLDRPRWERRAI